MALAQTLHIDASIGEVWRDYAAGRITDSEAERRVGLLDAQRPVSGREPRAVPVIKRIARRYQRSPDRQKSHERRAGLAADYAALPRHVRCLFQEAGAAVLAVIAHEQQCHARCELHVEAIAARAGVSVRTVQNTRRRATELGLITVEERRIPGRKSLTNIIRIVAADWVAWLKRGSGSIGCKTVTGRKILQPTKVSRKKEGIRAEASTSRQDSG